VRCALRVARCTLAGFSPGPDKGTRAGQDKGRTEQCRTNHGPHKTRPGKSRTRHGSQNSWRRQKPDMSRAGQGPDKTRPDKPGPDLSTPDTTGNVKDRIKAGQHTGITREGRGKCQTRQGPQHSRRREGMDMSRAGQVPDNRRLETSRAEHVPDQDPDNIRAGQGK
jgi:hypothetical protein